MEDEKILALLQTDPERGLLELIEKYGGLVKAVTGRILRSHQEDIEECVADTFIRIWKNAPDIATRQDTIKGYIICAARSIAIDRYRKLQKEKEQLSAEDELLADTHSMMAEVESMQGVADIRSMVEEMGQPDKEIFLRRYFLCQPIKEIAALLQMGEKAIESRLFRGRQKLKLQLKQKGTRG